MSATHLLRDYVEEDEDAVLKAWLHSWRDVEEYKHIDFGARLQKFREHWRTLVSTCVVKVAVCDGNVAGAVTINCAECYVDQVFVAPAFKERGIGSDLLEAAKRLCPSGFTLDVNLKNKKAVEFYLRRRFKLWSSWQNVHGEMIYRLKWRSNQ